ncbi:MAG: NUDIX domain-containing protein [Chitinophagales bacterium]|jgi:bifunctional NMN adenylyltransferase/nudix hydrolase
MGSKSGTGVIVGRFQVVELNALHKKMIGKVLRRHKKVAVFLGSNPAPSNLNPIDLMFRVDMFESHYKDKLEVFEMPDLPDDRIWSQELDRRILEMRPEGNVVLYGTMEGFLERYSGRYSAELLEASPDDIPELIGMDDEWDIRSFRAGMLYAAMRRFPTVYPTVDVAVFRNEMRQVLLARKEHETRYRFPGGFSDPEDDSFEMAAMRELVEECGDIVVDNLMYLGSLKVDDWRYRETADGIITHLYACSFVSGNPSPNDDIAEIKWFDVEKIKEELFVPEHKDLWNLLNDFLQEQNPL